MANNTVGYPTQCFLNFTDDHQAEVYQEQRKQRLDWVFKIYFGWLPLPAAAIAISFTVLYIFTVQYAIRRRRVSRKCYLLLLNKAVGDALCALSAMVAVVYVLISNGVNRDVMAILETFFIGSFWSATVSFVALSIIKLYAVWQPLRYRQTFTMQRCKKLIFFSWVMFGAIAVSTLSVHALVKIPSLSRWSGCKMETCLSLMYKIRNSFVVAMYAVTILAYFITIMLVKRSQRTGDSFQGRFYRKDSCKKTRFPMWKLSLNVGTFALLNLSYVLWSINIILQQNNCYFLQNLADMMRLLGVIRFTMLLRILVDPIISFIIDMQIRWQILYWSGLRSKSLDISPRPSQKTVTSEGLSCSSSVSHDRAPQASIVATIC